MPPRTPPEDPVERESASLLRKLRAARGFCFVVYFVEDQRPVHRIRSRLDAELKALGRRLVVLAAESACELVASTLGGIFDAARSPAEPGGLPVVWAEAFREAGDADWDAQRRLLLMRMNERRSRFEAENTVSLILLLPAGAHRETASLAPDLWHVRLHSATLSGVSSPAPAPVARRPTEPPTAPAFEPPPAVVYWNALHDGTGGEVDALDALSLEDGFEAVRAWQGRSEAGRAVALAEQLAGLARDRLDRSDAQSGAGRRRELAVALREWGDSLLQADRLDAALAVLDEGLSLAADGSGVDGDVALVSSLFLSRGDALLAAGRAPEALAAFEESLALLRRSPTDPGASGPWVVLHLLGRIGDAALRADDASHAVTAFAESASLYRDLLASRPGDSALLQALSSALAQLGDAEWRQGRGERALGAYREGLRALDEASGRGSDSGFIERERALLLLRVGGIEQAVGREDAAVGTYETVLALVRRSAALGALVEPFLDELARRLETIARPGGEALPAASRLLEAVRAFEAAPESASTEEAPP